MAVPSGGEDNVLHAVQRLLLSVMDTVSYNSWRLGFVKPCPTAHTTHIVAPVMLMCMGSIMYTIKVNSVFPLGYTTWCCLCYNPMPCQSNTPIGSCLSNYCGMRRGLELSLHGAAGTASPIAYFLSV